MSARVCHITSVHRAEDTRIFYRECCSLARNGYEVHLVVVNQPGADTQEEVTVHSISTPERNRYARMTKTVNEVAETALALRASIYHVHDPELLRIVGRLRKHGARVICDIHEDVPGQILAKEWIPGPLRPVVAGATRIGQKLAIHRADAVVTSTAFVAGQLAGNGVPAVVLHNYPRTERVARAVPWSSRTREVAYVGHINRIRGVQEMVQMLDYFDGELTLAGPFETASLENEIRQLPNWARVNYLGRIPRDEVDQLLRNSRAGLATFLPVPYHLRSESNKMFEYMAAGVPVVASDFPAWRQFVTESGTGMLVDPTRPQDIATALQFLRDHPDEAEAMGENGRKAVLERFNWDAEERKLLALYRSLLEESAS